MTREEAKKILEAYIACESKKAHFKCSEYNCDDDCPLLYDMGTVGEYNEAINVAIQALEQEPCEDAISKQAVLDLPRIKTHNEWGNIIYESVNVEDVRQLPSVKPQERTGHWIRFKEFENGFYHIKCSECGQYWSIDGHAKIFKYCFNCGARMEVEQNG